MINLTDFAMSHNIKKDDCLDYDMKLIAYLDERPFEVYFHGQLFTIVQEYVYQLGESEEDMFYEDLDLIFGRLYKTRIGVYWGNVRNIILDDVRITMSHTTLDEYPQRVNGITIENMVVSNDQKIALKKIIDFKREFFNQLNNSLII